MIVPPVEDRKRGATRAIVEALAQATPITAGLARIYQFTHPSDMERQLAAWREEVSKTINDHELLLGKLADLLTPRLAISGEAMALARWLVEESGDGLRGACEFSALETAFPSIPNRELEEACSELKHYGMVSYTAAMSHPIRRVKIEYPLYWAFDPLVKGTDPCADASLVAELILAEDRPTVDVAQIDALLGWPRRRFNPALAFVIGRLPDGSISKAIQNTYPTSHIILSSDARFQMRALLGP